MKRNILIFLLILVSCWVNSQQLFWFSHSSPASYVVIGNVVENLNVNYTAGGSVDVYEYYTDLGAFRNNVISANNIDHHIVLLGSEASTAYDNDLDGIQVTGNKLTWTGTFSTTEGNEGILVGYNKNANIRYNYIKDCPYGTPVKSSGMVYTSGGVAYNIYNGRFRVGTGAKGVQNVNFFNNTFYCTSSTSDNVVGLIYINSNFEDAVPPPSSGCVVKNNIFYTKHQIPNIWIDGPSMTGFVCDYNIYYCEDGAPIFNANGTEYTFTQWQALGYDTHSIVVNPNFVDFTSLIPSSALGYGTNLGTTWSQGLSTSAVWGSGSPTLISQTSVWQVGAYVVSGTTNYLTVNPTSSNVAYTSGTVSINVSSNTSWTASLDFGGASSWATITSGSSGVSNGTIVVSYNSNNTGTSRTLTVNVAATGLTTQTSSIIQASTTSYTADYYVATTGNDNNPGTISSPFATLDKAYSVMTAGQLCYVRGGIYNLTSTLNFTGRNGTSVSNRIKIWNYPGETPILDLNGINSASQDHGIYVTANYFHFKGFEVRNYNQDGSNYIATIFLDGAKYSKFENLKIHDCGGAGFYFEHDCNQDTLMNTDTYNNYDPNTVSPGQGGNADGIHMCVNTTGYTNYILGCRSWNNSDDGLDANCNIGIFIIKDTWAFHNGYIPNTNTAIGDGNGFKLGGTPSGTNPLTQQLRNCLSFNNLTRGYNHNDGGNTFKFEYCQAYNNGAEGFNLTYSSSTPYQLTGNISWNNTFANVDISSGSIQSHNNWNDGITPTSSDYVSIDTNLATASRQSDGSLPSNGLLQVKSSSALYVYCVDPLKK